MPRTRLLVLVALAIFPIGCSPSSDCGCADDDGGLDDAPSDAESAPACTPVSPNPGKGVSGYGMDGWHWERQGVVLQDDGAAAQSGYLAPAAVVVGETIHLWLTRKQGTTHRIHHSTSLDGKLFTAPVEVTGLAGENTMYPSVIHDEQGFSMWYGSGLIDRATSQDGASWTMVAEGVLKPGADGQFDSVSLLYPSVIRTPSGYVMYYTGWNGGPFGIGRAESSDGTTWTRNPQGAVLAVGAATDFDNHAVAQPCAVLAGEVVLLWYGGYDTSVANPGPYRVGLAQATDGIAVERRGVTLDLAPSGPEAWSTRDPAVVPWKGGFWMAYAVMGDDAVYRIAAASSQTCAPR